MDLPNLLSKIKSPSSEPKQFIAIEIALSSVKTAIWHVMGEKAHVTAIGSIQDWDGTSVEDLLLAIDASLSEALAGLDSEPNEVIFGLSETWVSQEGIATDKKPYLKTICFKLGLEPVGFVVTEEAVVHFLQETEGGTPSAILIRLYPAEVNVSHIHLGSLLSSQAVGRSDQISLDVQEGIARFPTSKTLPSRMLLYDGKEDLEDIKQTLIDFDWTASGSFLHVPQIEILDKTVSIKAVALSGGMEVAKSLGITESSPTSEAESLSPDIQDEAPEPELEVDSTSAVTDFSSKLGFAPIDTTSLAKPATSPLPIDDSSSPDLGGLDASSPLDIEDEIENVIPVPEGSPLHPEASMPARLRRSFRLPRLRRPKFSLPKPRLRPSRLPIHPIIIVGILSLLIFFGGGAAYYLTVPRADLTIYLKPDTYEKEVSFTLDPEIASADISSNTIPAELEAIELTGSKSISTTGTKVIGDRAQGNVEIFNRTLSTVNLDAGEVIQVDDLAFTLNDDVTIASASTEENDDFSITRKPSSQSVAVTAADIGTEYNLNEGIQFSVEGYSKDEVLARATSAFTGGSAEEIQVVAEADLENLRTSLATDLSTNLHQEINSQSQNEQGIVPLSDPEIIKESFSHQIGAETGELKLDATLNQAYYTYQTSDVALLGQQLIIEEIPPNYTFIKEATKVEIKESAASATDSASVTAQVQMYLMPQIDIAAITNNVKGKYPPDTELFLKGLPNYVKAETTITPKLPSRLSTFPRQAEKITVTIKPAGI